MIIYNDKKDSKWNVIESIVSILVNGLVLVMASSIFKGFYIGSFWYAVIAAMIIMFLNLTVKPVISLLTLPITVFTLGLSYPIINVIILKIAGLLMGSNFIVEGWIVPFFIAIFISIMKVILDVVITKQIVGSK